MNSLHEQCPNSDPKQCPVTKLGRVHSAHTQNPGRAHTAPAVLRLSAQPTGCAHVTRTVSASRALAGRALVATRPGSLLQVATSKRGRNFVSLAKPQARSRLPFRVATSWKTKPGRDANPMSRPPFRPSKLIRSRPPKWGRDFNSQQARSRRQFHVATSFPA